MYPEKAEKAMSPERQYRMNIQSQIRETRRELQKLETRIKIVSFLEKHSENEMHEMIASVAGEVRNLSNY